MGRSIFRENDKGQFVAADDKPAIEEMNEEQLRFEIAEAERTVSALKARLVHVLRRGTSGPSR